MEPVPWLSSLSDMGLTTTCRLGFFVPLSMTAYEEKVAKRGWEEQDCLLIYSEGLEGILDLQNE